VNLDARNFFNSARAVRLLGPTPKPARQKDDEADQEHQAEAAATIDRAAPVKTAAAEQKE
jgi:hypothetical protein